MKSIIQSIIAGAQSRTASDEDLSQVGAALESIEQELRNTGGNAFVSTAAAALTANPAMEGIDATGVSHDMNAVLGNLHNALADLHMPALEGHVGKNMFNATQRMAALYAAGLTGDTRASMDHMSTMANKGDKDTIASIDNVGRVAAMESYDEKEARLSAIYTVAYNLSAARQDEFGEAFFRTIVVPPEQHGFYIQINLINLINAIRREASGAKSDYNRVNIVHVIRNPDLINSESTILTPVYRTASQQFFVDSTLVTPQTIVQENKPLVTSYLAFGKEFSLIGISQTDHQLDVAMADETDSIDTDIKLGELLLKVGDDIVKFDMRDFPQAQFHGSQQGDEQRMDLFFNTKDVRLDKLTTRHDGSDLVDLAALKTGDWQVKLDLDLYGYVIRDKGDTKLTKGEVKVSKIYDNTGKELALTDAAAAAIVALFDDAELFGYTLEARLTNLNQRHDGQLMETRVEKQSYAVPLLPPFKIRRPQGIGDATNASDVASLVTLTRAMASGKAVNELLRVRGMLERYRDDRSKLTDIPKVFGMARHLMQPFYDDAELDIEKIVNSMNSTDLVANVQSVIVNTLRDMIFRGIQESGYKAAADMLAGGESAPPNVIIGTDQTLARYLMITGDLRTMGPKIGKVIIVETQNEKMEGRILATLAQDGTPDGVPHPLDFGFMAWKTELVVILPLHRNGANSKEVIVQPSFRHVHNMPFLVQVMPKNIDVIVKERVKLSTDTTIVTP